MSNLEEENAFNSTQYAPAEHLVWTDVLLSSRGRRSVCLRLRALSQEHLCIPPSCANSTCSGSITDWDSPLDQEEGTGLIMGQWVRKDFMENAPVNWD